MIEEIPHEVKTSVMGPMVLYRCVECASPLTSSIDEAGRQDSCPDCGRVFVVPGTAHRDKMESSKLNMDAVRANLVEEKLRSRKDAVVRRTARQSSRAEALQLDRDPLKEWLIYTVIIVVLLIAFGWRHSITAITSDSSGITLLIIGIFIIGLGINLAGILRLRSEYVCAAACIQKLRENAGFAEIVNAPAAGILHQHVKDLANIARYDNSVSQDSLVTLMYSRMMARSKMVDILSGVLVSLGLIGTVVGLISMTDGLSAALDSLGEKGDAASLMAGMRSTMAGLGTAFYTTLIGAMLGSIVLRILNNIYTSNVDHLVSHVASTTEVTIVPRLKRMSRSKEPAQHAIAK